MVLGGDYEEDYGNNNGCGLGEELRNFEDIDGSFNAGDNFGDQQFNGPNRGRHKGSAQFNLNQSINSDSEDQIVSNNQINQNTVASCTQATIVRQQPSNSLTQDAQKQTPSIIPNPLALDPSARRQSSLIDPATLIKATKILLQQQNEIAMKKPQIQT